MKFVAALTVILLLCSFVYAAPIANTDGKVQAIALPIVNSILAGYNDGDYSKWAKHFSSDMRTALPERKFETTRKTLLRNLGKFLSKEYVGFLTQENMTVVLYKGRFKKGESLIKVVLSKERGKVIVTGLWFQ